MDYEDEGDPKSYSNEEIPGNEYDNDNDIELDDEPNRESQISNVDVNDDYVITMLDQTIEEININEDPNYE